MNAHPKVRMTVEEFIPWALQQPQGRYELVNGQVVAMAPERARHNLTKAAAYMALRSAVRTAGLPCTVFTDGMTVRIDPWTAREPDASVQCGSTVDPDCLLLDAPLIVVEVVSPSSRHDDTGLKVAQYFKVATIRHYLILDPVERIVIHHCRDEAGSIRTRVHEAGAVTLDPPGLSIPLAHLFDGE